MTNNSFAQKREALLARYVESFNDKIDELIAELEKFSQITEETSIYDFTDLRLIVHKLAGSAGSYGFSDIGSLASALDKRLLIEKNNVMAMNVIKTMTMELVHELRKHTT